MASYWVLVAIALALTASLVMSIIALVVAAGKDDPPVTPAPSPTTGTGTTAGDHPTVKTEVTVGDTGKMVLETTQGSTVTGESEFPVATADRDGIMPASMVQEVAKVPNIVTRLNASEATVAAAVADMTASVNAAVSVIDDEIDWYYPVNGFYVSSQSMKFNRENSMVSGHMTIVRDSDTVLKQDNGIPHPIMNTDDAYKPGPAYASAPYPMIGTVTMSIPNVPNVFGSGALYLMATGSGTGTLIGVRMDRWIENDHVLFMKVSYRV